MSSGFVSTGTSDTPIERDAKWLAAQQQIEATRQRKAEESRRQDGRSLFEVLEANKVAKEEAFQEATRLKNQFRALDEDEADFLDEVLESTRVEEARVKKETTQGLQTFRKQQEEADKKARERNARSEGSPEVQEEWIAAGGRKRKKGKDREPIKGVKARKSSKTEDATQTVVADGDDASRKSSGTMLTNPTETKSSSTPNKSNTQAPPEEIEPVGGIRQPGAKTPPAKRSCLGLVEYASDDEE